MMMMGDIDIDPETPMPPTPPAAATAGLKTHRGLAELPHEVLRNILCFLAPVDVVGVATTLCRRTRFVCSALIDFPFARANLLQSTAIEHILPLLATSAFHHLDDDEGGIHSHGATARNSSSSINAGPVEYSQKELQQLQHLGLNPPTSIVEELQEGPITHDQYSLLSFFDRHTAHISRASDYATTAVTTPSPYVPALISICGFTRQLLLQFTATFVKDPDALRSALMTAVRGVGSPRLGHLLLADPVSASFIASFDCVQDFEAVLGCMLRASRDDIRPIGLALMHALISAIQSDSVNVVRHLIATRRMDLWFNNGTFFNLAAQHGAKNVTEYLITLYKRGDGGDSGGGGSGSQITLSTTSLDSVMLAACLFGHTRIVTLLVEAGADPAAESGSSVVLACQGGSLDVLEFLLSTNRVFASSHHNMAIRVACEAGHVDIVKRLLQDPDVDPGAGGDFPIRVAVDRGHIDIVQRLLLHPDVDPKAGMHHCIRSAASRGHHDILKMFIDQVYVGFPGVDLTDPASGIVMAPTVSMTSDLASDVRDELENFSEALHNSIENGHVECLRLLFPRFIVLEELRARLAKNSAGSVRSGSDSISLEDLQETVQIAIEEGYVDVVRTLVQYVRADEELVGKRIAEAAAASAAVTAAAAVVPEERASPVNDSDGKVVERRRSSASLAMATATADDGEVPFRVNDEAGFEDEGTGWETEEDEDVVVTDKISRDEMPRKLSSASSLSTSLDKHRMRKKIFQDHVEGWPELVVASRFNHREIVELFLSLRREDASWGDRMGLIAAAHHALAEGHLEILQILLESEEIDPRDVATDHVDFDSDHIASIKFLMEARKRWDERLIIDAIKAADAEIPAVPANLALDEPTVEPVSLEATRVTVIVTSEDLADRTWDTKDQVPDIVRDQLLPASLGGGLSATSAGTTKESSARTSRTASASMLSSPSSDNISPMRRPSSTNCDELSLQLAAMAEDDSELRRLLLLDPKHSLLESALQVAAQNGRVGSVRILLEKLAVSSHSMERVGRLDALCDAATAGHMGVVKSLMELVPTFSWNAAEVAIGGAGREKHLEIVRYIFNYYDKGKFTCKDSSCYCRNETDLHLRRTGERCLMEACEGGSVEVARFLIAPLERDEAGELKGAGVNPGVFDTYIAAAVESFNLELVQLLIDDGRADPGLDDSTACRSACEINFIDALRLLLSTGRCQPDGHCLGVAAEEGYEAIVSLLLQHPDSVLSEVDDLNYAVQAAAENGNTGVLRQLLQLPQADPSADDGYALAAARKNGHDDCVALLIATGKISLGTLALESHLTEIETESDMSDDDDGDDDDDDVEGFVVEDGDEIIDDDDAGVGSDGSGFNGYEGPTNGASIAGESIQVVEGDTADDGEWVDVDD